MTEWIGYMAAILTTLCYIPQAVHVLRTRKTDGISLLAYAALFSGISLWFIYGILICNWPLIAANGIVLPLLGIIIVMKIRLS